MAEEIEIKSIRDLIAEVKASYNFDFSNYAITSFKRRLERALIVFSCNTIYELIAKIKADKTFYDSFLKEITVNTTEMFRDPSFWRKLREDILPSISDHK